jgi:outer membrane protein assembly factor BamE (lipoprotein component of BamABCDE complex)
MTLLIVTASVSLACQPHIAPGVNPAAIRRVTIGMTSQQVLAILGQPVRIRSGYVNGVLYDYARPGMLNNAGLWVSFHNNAVREVHAKRYFWIADDKTIYDLQADRPVLETADFEPLFTR